MYIFIYNKEVSVPLLSFAIKKENLSCLQNQTFFFFIELIIFHRLNNIRIHYISRTIRDRDMGMVKMSLIAKFIFMFPIFIGPITNSF